MCVALTGATLTWPLAVVGYTVYLWLTIHCPQCTYRFELGEKCHACNLPRHRDSSGFFDTKS
jgi:hypothetical protein